MRRLTYNRVGTQGESPYTSRNSDLVANAPPNPHVSSIGSTTGFSRSGSQDVEVSALQEFENGNDRELPVCEVAKFVIQRLNMVTCIM